MQHRYWFIKWIWIAVKEKTKLNREMRGEEIRSLQKENKEKNETTGKKEISKSMSSFFAYIIMHLLQ